MQQLNDQIVYLTIEEAKPFVETYIELFGLSAKTTNELSELLFDYYKVDIDPKHIEYLIETSGLEDEEEVIEHFNIWEKNLAIL